MSRKAENQKRSRERDWRGRTALVTGASSGIGRAVALRLAAEGMQVMACARRAEKLAELADEAEGEMTVVAADLRQESAIAGVFANARKRHGGIDVLVNNAGLGHAAPLMSGDSAMWREMLELNVLALCICTREAVRDMRARGDDGHVIHIASMASHRVPPGSGVYSATKFAVRSLTEGLRQELRAADSGIRVTAISPGFVETEFAEHYHQSDKLARQTYGRYKCIQPEDVADAVWYAVTRPAHVQIHDILMRPTEQPN